MSTALSDYDNFNGRVNHAVACLSRQIEMHSRGFAACFERFDREAVITKLVRLAAEDRALTAGIRAFFGGKQPHEWPWTDIAAKHAAVANEDLRALAQQFTDKAKALPIRERLALLEPVKLDDTTLNAAVAFFRANPDESSVYVRWDGKCLPEKHFIAQNSVRFSGEGDDMKAHGGVTGNLVSIATDGFPMRVSRKHKHIAAALAAEIAQQADAVPTPVMTHQQANPTVQERLLRIHAYWLAVGHDTSRRIDDEIAEAAKRIGMTPEQFWEPFSGMGSDEEHDWMDRMFCSRPADWKPEDSESVLRASCNPLPVFSELPAPVKQGIRL